MHEETAHSGRRRRGAAHSHPHPAHLGRLFHHFLFAEEDGPSRRGRRRRGGGPKGPPGGPGGPFGGRRPLRFLARKLDLSSEQFDAIAVVFSDLRTERAQMKVDTRRAASALAEVMTGDSFDDAKAKAAREALSAARARLDEHVGTSLKRLHEILEPPQRAALASLIREMPPWFL